MFSHLFEEKDDEQNLNERINIENVDIAKATEQALLGEESSNEDFRRTIMSPQPKSERQSTSKLRRSSRIQAGGSMNINSSNAIYMQSQIDWPLCENKSNDNVLVAHLNELKQGHIFKKSELLDIESDDDEIDEHISPNPIDELFTIAGDFV